jgi:hypothetical protein
VLNKKPYDEESIKNLLKESDTFPTPLDLKNELKEINHSIHWINRAKEVLSNKSENRETLENLKARDIDRLTEKIAEIKTFTKEDAIKFLVNEKTHILDLLAIVSNNDSKLKPDNINLVYIANLLEESKSIRLSEEENPLLNGLKKILE